MPPVLGRRVLEIDRRARRASSCYANGGGRFFATHFSYTWLFQNSPFSGTATWDVNANRNSTTNGGSGVPFTGNVDVAKNPKGAVFVQWLNLLKALSNASPPQVTIEAGRHDVDAVEGQSVDWIDGTDPSPPSAAKSQMLLHYTFDTPVGQAAQCGHAIFSDFHVNNQSSTNADIFPAECEVAALTPQERTLEYMIWDLQSCVPPPPTTTCVPRTCAQQNLGCGPAGDGCGNVIQCGMCVSPQTCGGGGVSSRCGAPPAGGHCTPATCASQNLACGPASDGCGNLLDCGQCIPPLSCGGGGVPGQRGAGDAGVRCDPSTCAAQNIEMRPGRRRVRQPLELRHVPAVVGLRKRRRRRQVRPARLLRAVDVRRREHRVRPRGRRVRRRDRLRSMLVAGTCGAGGFGRCPAVIK